ncbi:integral membrane protein [Liquorilactobacillus sucicola DSM 21376 = JCM 15457]|uniref:Periplasmic secreted protein n=1 Tax=Liquorilactobacillus sucicola DSM 21376 = JCM 15457 TaxID=1423806 RepID=A0A023CTX4_9LACO|nr:DUF1440 domain-containing protein [Liquorilactobacillus sucicola]KRN05117.1 hypothetical protein FD15_GL001660 [Liquorilactobacillus sucicola DSM 21376 = JCM 15457]GAJ25164.1 integral membrane protein [Liquorilactobacillus sucicola DSM 21376 = JCM 15457]
MQSVAKESAGTKFWRAVYLGLIGGIISGFVKIGWEGLLPPRTTIRNLTNPPQELMQQMGIPYRITHAYFTYSGQHVQFVSLILHFGFSIVFAILYCWLAEYWLKVTFLQGTVYGFVIWIAFHIIILPALGTVPAPWLQPFDEHFSEFLGHLIWAWTFEICRHDFKARMKHVAVD